MWKTKSHNESLIFTYDIIVENFSIIMAMRRSAIQEIVSLSTVIIILNKRRVVPEWRAAPF
ncbi:hypothetical protein D3502_18010 [Salmonella enterica]|nr:hypothetical protein [Salmonella enterica]